MRYRMREIDRQIERQITRYRNTDEMSHKMREIDIQKERKLNIEIWMKKSYIMGRQRGRLRKSLYRRAKTVE